MSFDFLTRRLAVLAIAGLLAGCSTTTRIPVDRTLNVLTSGGLYKALNELKPAYERGNRVTVNVVLGASMGATSEAVPNRLARGEPADVVLVPRAALDALVASGQVIRGSEVDIALSSLGVAVRKGAPKPDIGSVEALRRTLLAAPSIAYSDSVSGTYYANELVKKLDIEAQVMPRSQLVRIEFVGSVVARGDAAIGLQQISELREIAGVDVVGPLPPEVQLVTVYAAGIAARSRDPEAAAALVRHLSSTAAIPAIERAGLEPLTKR